ncbi:MAG: shikimate dehydrogenase [Pyrinomonadaceae bacterium]|nr:shikimate dehydrogenase [Pyrinomonadaceae bacterium]
MSDSDWARLLCVPVGARRVDELLSSAARAAKAADIIELRLDYLEESQLKEINRPSLQPLAASLARPLIITLRSIEQGGRCEFTLPRRIEFWQQIFRDKLPSEVFVDLEFELLSYIRQREEELYAALNQNQIICSHHHFGGSQVDLNQLYERMKSITARVLKIAVQVDDADECVSLFQLLKRARGEEREMIAVGMGEAGFLTRILAPARGSFLTYAALDAQHTTAPGQIAAHELRDLYRFHAIKDETAITGLVGSPVAHSVSPQMHNRAFAAKGIDAVYIPFEVRALDKFLTRMAHPRTREIDWNLRGFSVTAPHKTKIIEYLDWIEPAAREAGAINTVVVEDGALYGYNTDAQAALAPLRGIVELSNCRVAVIGAGGAARALSRELKNSGARVTVFARNAERAAKLAEEFDSPYAPLEGACYKNFDVVINATTLGTRGTSGANETPATVEQLQGARIAYDLVYNPPQTIFLRAAAQAGCQTVGGLAMLVGQAIEQFKLWTGEDAPLDVMQRAAIEALEERARESIIAERSRTIGCETN